MAKRKESEAGESITLKQVLSDPAYLGGRILGNEEVVFLKILGKGTDQKMRRSEIDARMLRRCVVAIQRNFGGVEHKYSAVRFVVR